MNNKIVVGLLPSTMEPAKVVKELIDQGFRSDDISLIVKEENTVHVVDNKTDGVLNSAAEGVGKGGIIGALTGLLIGLGVITIPGIGGLLVGGPLISYLGLTGAAAATAGGAMTGGLAGGLLGGLMKLGFDEGNAQIYYDQISKGSTLIMVGTDADQVALTKAEDTLKNAGATEVRTVDIAS